MKMKLTLLLFFLLLAGCSDRYVPFHWVQYNWVTKEYVIYAHFSEDYNDNILHNLSYFGQKHIMINGKLYITNELWEDKELLSMICSMQDTKWIKNRIDKKTKRTKWSIKVR
jgi:hypothetical protein